MVPFTAIVQQDAISPIFGNGEPDSITTAGGRKFCALRRIAQITKFPQLCIGGRGALVPGGTGATEARAQRQTPRKGPVNIGTSRGGKEIWAGHNNHILVPFHEYVLDFFL
jgi:hypothetical protein